MYIRVYCTGIPNYVHVYTYIALYLRSFFSTVVYYYYYYGFYTGLDSEFCYPCYIENVLPWIFAIEFRFYVIATPGPPPIPLDPSL